MTGTITRGKILRADFAQWDGKTATHSRLDATGGTVTGLAIGNEVDVLQVFGSGTSRTRATIAAAVAYIGSTSVILNFAPGTWTIDDDLTVPSNFVARIPQGCTFDISSGKTLTFSGPVMQEASSCTTGAGTAVGLEGNGVKGAYFARTTDESGASVTPKNYAYPPGDIRRYGALGDDSTDNTTAIQNCISVCERSSLEMYVPFGIFRHGALTISNSSYDGFRIRGESTGDYGTSAGNAPTRGSILKYTGSGTGITVDAGSATNAPKYLEVDGITFVGNSGADDGVLVNKSTWCRFVRCGWYGYSQTAGNAVRLSIGAGTFTGGIRFLLCYFAGNYRDVYADSQPVNIVQFYACDFHSSTYNFVAGPDTSTVNFIRTLIFEGCDLEETVKSCVLLNGGVAGFRFVGNYVEQNDSGENDPRIWLANTGTSPLSQGILIENNVFSKQLGAASAAVIRIRNADGVKVRNNWSAFPSSGSVTDRWSTELVSTVSDYEVELMNVAFGATSYPIRVASTSYTTHIDARSLNFLGSTLQKSSSDLLTNTITGNTQNSNYAFVLTDAGIANITVNGGAATTYTIPPQSSVTWPSNAVINMINLHSTNNLSLARGSGVALYLANTNKDVTIAPRRFVQIRRASSDVWFIANDGSGIT